MTAVLDDFEALKRNVERDRREHDQAVGSFNELLRRVNEDYACKTLVDAESMLLKLQKEKQVALDAYLKARKEFDKKYPNLGK